MTDDHKASPFGDHAISYACLGWAVVPAIGKAPIIKGYNKFEKRPGLRTVENWARRHHSANIAYVPGLSRPTRGEELVIVDADDDTAVSEMKARFGDTPGKAGTRRGQHFIYRIKQAHELSTIMHRSTNLKPFGLNADLKFGRQIVIAPPSRHPLDPGFSYYWKGCDETVIRDVTIFDTEALVSIMSRDPQNSSGLPENAMRDGSRGQWLNDQLCKDVAYCDTFDDLLNIAQDLNQSLPSRYCEPLAEGEVIKRAKEVWTGLEEGRIEQFVGKRATAQIDADETRELCARFRHGPDALALLALLRAEHGARNGRGEAFALACHAMARSNTLGYWAPKRYAKARDALLEARYIVRVSPKFGRRPAQYRLPPRRPIPSFRQRRLKGFD